MTIATVGVYGFTLETFLAALRRAGIGLVLDIRQRRAVRGRVYAWANARRLQAALADAAIGYRRVERLAPPTAMRELQRAADAAAGEGPRTRTTLSPAFARAYRDEILAHVDLGALIAELTVPAALLCVERDPEACHRGIIAHELADAHGATVEHLRP